MRKENLISMVEDRKAELIDLVSRLIRINSENPTGTQREVVDFVEKYLEKAGIAYEETGENPDYPCVVARMGSDDGYSLIFNGHVDVVPAGDRGLWDFDPFCGTVTDSQILGRGTSDMKAGVVANMFAARALKELGLIDVPMTLMFSPDEELGAPTATRVYRERIGGARAVICAEPGFPDGGVTTERRGSGHFHMRISGISAHAGRCYEDGASAILELAHKIVALDAFVDAQAQTVVNTGLISGGNSANAVAPWADARIHITFNTVDAAERLVENVRAVAARTFVPRTTTRISGGIRLHPLEYTADVETLFGMAERACAAMGGYTIRRNRALGASEAGFTASVLGIPSICSMGPEGAELHSPREYLSVDTVLPRCKMIALTAIQAARAFPAPRV